MSAKNEYECRVCGDDAVNGHMDCYFTLMAGRGGAAEELASILEEVASYGTCRMSNAADRKASAEHFASLAERLLNVLRDKKTAKV